MDIIRIFLFCVPANASNAIRKSAVRSAPVSSVRSQNAMEGAKSASNATKRSATADVSVSNAQIQSVMGSV